MTYDMGGQATTYPYPPPPPVPAPVVSTPPRKQFSKWWPISFFIAAVLFIIIGGGLMGAWAASGTCSYSSYSSYSSYRTYRCSNTGLFYGGVACVAIGGVCKLVAWILLIVFCVKRNRSAVGVTYTYQPIDNYHAAAAAAPPYHAPAPTPPKQAAAAMGGRYCGTCGASVTTPFCAQCGNRV